MSKRMSTCERVRRMRSTLVDGGAAARGRAERHFETCGPRLMTAPPCEAHGLATDVLALAEAHDEAIRLLALVTELAAATTKHEPGRGYVAITEAKAFLAEQDPALAAAGEGAE